MIDEVNYSNCKSAADHFRDATKMVILFMVASCDFKWDAGIFYDNRRGECATRRAGGRRLREELGVRWDASKCDPRR